MSITLPEPLASAGFTTEQKEYLTGLFAGVAARGKRFGDVEAAPEAKHEDLLLEERLKRELHPLDAYEQIVENARANTPPDKEDTFRFKWNGLFFLTPVKDAFMARLRIPGGVLKSYQLREVALIAQELTTGYVQITTRSNLQLRLIQPKAAAEVLRRVQSVGLHTGADNIRNLTMNPTAGIDPVELIDVQPLLQELAGTIVNDRSFYDLPRKFNIAYDGGGFIGAVEDTNDIGAKAVRIEHEILFRIGLGGATGHKAFASDLGVLVPPNELNQVIVAIVRVYIERGCRTDRKKARLKHLLEKMSLADYLAEVEKKLGTHLRRAPIDPSEMRWASQELPHSHVGDFPQKQRGLNYVGATCPVGQITEWRNSPHGLAESDNPECPRWFRSDAQTRSRKSRLLHTAIKPCQWGSRVHREQLLQICPVEYQGPCFGIDQVFGKAPGARSARQHSPDWLSEFLRSALHWRHRVPRDQNQNRWRKRRWLPYLHRWRLR